MEKFLQALKEEMEANKDMFPEDQVYTSDYRRHHRHHYYHHHCHHHHHRRRGRRQFSRRFYSQVMI